MLYWPFWVSYWKQLAELGSAWTPEASASPTPGSEKNETSEAAFPPHEKYEYLTEYGTQILCLLAEDGCRYLSRNFEAITGHDSAPYLQDAFFSLIQEDFQERFRETLENLPEQDEPVAFRCKLRHADQKYYWYLFQLHGKRRSNDDGIVCVLENVHDTVQIQNRLQKAKLEAELALRARSEFLANMSHDLRTPLNAVIGFAQIMEKEIFGRIETPQYVEYVKHIQQSGYDLLAKIEDLLEISNLDAGRVTLEREAAYLSDIIKQAMEAQQHHAQAADVQLHYEATPQDLLLSVDRLKLQHILGHLISNAIRHSPTNGIVTIAAAHPEKLGWLMLEVRDQGEGIAKVKLQSILTAFKEDHCWTAKNNRGVGLGLALTKEFVALHDGAVDIDSSAKGTCVRITLPPACVRPAHQSEPEPLREAVS